MGCLSVGLGQRLVDRGDDVGWQQGFLQTDEARARDEIGHVGAERVAGDEQEAATKPRMVLLHQLV